MKTANKKGSNVQSDDQQPVFTRQTDTVKRKPSVFSALKNLLVVLLVFVAGTVFGANITNGTLGFGNSATSSNSQLPADLDYAEVERVYDVLRQNYDGELTVEELMIGLKRGLVDASGDPYTEYLSIEDATEFNSGLQNNSFEGIGARLGRDEEGTVVIESPLSGYPAEKAGLRAKDKIITVGDTSTRGMTTEQVVDLIRGKAGTKVKLEVLRNNSELKTFEITRESIEVPNVEHKMMEGNVGYLQLVQFSTEPTFVSEVRSAARDLKQSGAKSIVLDLRGNPGGSLEAAIEIASMWLPSGETILEERRDGDVRQVYKSTGDGTLRGMKTIVLIDEGSASASEILAGALRDNKAATLLGQTSYGKGKIQQIIPLADGSELKVTIAQWFPPNGKKIDKVGIKPDVEVKVSDEDIEAGKDPQLEAAERRLQSQ